MATLQIGATVVGVRRDNVTQAEPERLGTVTRAFSGRLRSTTRVEKRNWKFVSVPILQATIAALRTATAGGAFVNCTGDALEGATVSCYVQIGDAQLQRSGGTIYYVVTLTLREA